jgi:hypothetical protein
VRNWLALLGGIGDAHVGAAFYCALTKEKHHGTFQAKERADSGHSREVGAKERSKLEA